MNKKFAVFLLTLSIGAASAPAWAVCMGSQRQYQGCIAGGTPLAECDQYRVSCNDRCDH